MWLSLSQSLCWNLWCSCNSLQLWCSWSDRNFWRSRLLNWLSGLSQSCIYSTLRKTGNCCRFFISWVLLVIYSHSLSFNISLLGVGNSSSHSSNITFILQLCFDMGCWWGIILIIIFLFLCIFGLRLSQILILK